MRRALLLLAAAIGLAALQWYAYQQKVQQVSVKTYQQWATELDSTSRWRYGTVQTMHGCVLVRTPRSALVPTTQPRDGSLTAVMQADLRSIPRKLVLEWLLYLAVSVILLYGPPCIRRFRGRPDSRLAQAGTIFACTMASLLILIAPLIVATYGSSIYTTYDGPGAMIYSTGHHRLTGKTAETVSYRTVIEAVGMWPVRLMMHTPIVGVLPGIRYEHVIALGGAFTYALPAGIIALALSRRRHLESDQVQPA